MNKNSIGIESSVLKLKKKKYLCSAVSGSTEGIWGQRQKKGKMLIYWEKKWMLIKCIPAVLKVRFTRLVFEQSCTGLLYCWHAQVSFILGREKMLTKDKHKPTHSKEAINTNTCHVRVRTSHWVVVSSADLPQVRAEATRQGSRRKQRAPHR